MHFRLQLITVLDDGTEQLQEIADLARSETTLSTLGLTLEESKQLLAEVQHLMIDQQVACYLDQQRPCPACGQLHPLKQGSSARPLNQPKSASR